MRFQHRNTYAADPGEVRAMLTDRAFRERVCRELHAPEFTVDVRGDLTGDGMGPVTVAIDQTQPVRKVPSFATKFVGDTVEVRQVERWVSPTTAELELAIPGKPGHLHGRIELVPSSGGTEQLVSGDLKVSIPLVGGKLEGVIADLITMGMDTEERVGQAWLAGDR